MANRCGIKADGEAELRAAYDQYRAGHPFPRDSEWQAFKAGAHQFAQHIEHVAQFLNELYGIMVDPLYVGTLTVKEMQAQLLKAAREYRGYPQPGHDV